MGVQFVLQCVGVLGLARQRHLEPLALRRRRLTRRLAALTRCHHRLVRRKVGTLFVLRQLRFFGRGRLRLERCLHLRRQRLPPSPQLRVPLVVAVAVLLLALVKLGSGRGSAVGEHDEVGCVVLVSACGDDVREIINDVVGVICVGVVDVSRGAIVNAGLISVEVVVGWFCVETCSVWRLALCGDLLCVDTPWNLRWSERECVM